MNSDGLHAASCPECGFPMLVNVREEVISHHCPKCDAPVIFMSRVGSPDDWAEETPSIPLEKVAKYLGINPDPNKWTAEQRRQVDEAIEAGSLRFNDPESP